MYKTKLFKFLQLFLGSLKVLFMPSGSVVISLIRSWFLSRVSPRFRLAGDVCESLSSVDLAKAPASVPWIFSVMPWSPFCHSPLLYLLFLFLWLLWRESPSSHMGTQPYEVTRPSDLSHLVSQVKPLPWVGVGEGKGPPLGRSQQLELGGGGAGNSLPRLDGVCLLGVGEQVPSLCPPPPGMEVPST